MSRKRTLIAGLGLAGVAAAAAYGAARYGAARARRGEDPHGEHRFEPRAEREREVVSFDGAVLRVYETGEGVPVVLAHGVTNDHRSWTHQLEDLPARGVRVVAFDQRGHGGSTVGDAGFGVRPLAEDLAAILETLDLRRAVVVGHSMGGMGVQALACYHPEIVRERVAGLVLVGTTSHALPVWKHLERIPERVLAGGEVWFDRMMLHDDFGFLMTRVGLGRRPLASHVELVRRMVLECPVDTRQQATRALLDYDVRDLLCDVGVPVLVVSGSRDVLAPPSAGRRIADALPQARLEVLPGAGHMPMLERAELMTDLLATFAHEVGGGTGAPDQSPRAAAGG